MNDNALLSAPGRAPAGVRRPRESAADGLPAAGAAYNMHVLEDLGATVDPLIAGRPIEFRTRVAPGAETAVTDPHRLQRILGNLLVNAAKFTERGAIELSAERAGAEVVLTN